MLDTFTIDTFAPRVGELFRVIVDDTWEMRAQLAAVTPWGDESAVGRARTPFSLVFTAPRETNLPQGTYRVENENMEPFDLFLVPLGPQGDAMRYEAVFT